MTHYFKSQFYLSKSQNNKFKIKITKTATVQSYKIADICVKTKLSKTTEYC